ncbi:Sugar kinase of the NBD/HSP70 family, may contain an N-terminal HTH domain [Amycolatopsis xylanica]|uniref:Sugar kinase of the NBD/HSP70 family, may contain an N-terminal HTH domain n=1 Tax=Amycolatopsis xylanica TaxID=589385 RepID=A0A1H3FZ74_9PSEU|nr:ROK family protein [Amycolatopsis xylanica]SDX96276.1 Sugar kinase of the NBD/HSP70 family, may contain an N-terminal HTH domain [Amycolatopsis xylanica]
MLNGAVTGSLVKELNLQAVYQAVRQLHPVSRAQLARELGTSKPTTGRSIEALLAAGLIRQAPPPPGETGYGAVFFEPRPDAATVLGLDIGSRFLRGVLADLSGTELARLDLALKYCDRSEVVAKSVRLKDELAERAGVATVTAATVGVGGVVDPQTGAIRVANQPGLNGFAAAADLGAALGMPVTVENDVNLAAVGEGRHGAGEAVDDFAFLEVGSGVGAGLVLSGRLRRGHNGAAGEIDFVRPGWEFDPHSPAADAFLAHAERRLTQVMGSSLRSPLTTEAIMDAARDGDRLAASLVKMEADRIAKYAAQLTKVADLELIVLGGGLGQNGDLLLEPVRAGLVALTPYPPRVEVSRLGMAATLTGAVTLGLEGVLENLVPSRLAAAG